MSNFTVIRVHKKEHGQHCRVMDTFNSFDDAYFFMCNLNKMYKTDSLHFVIDTY